MKKSKPIHMSIWPTVYRVICGDDGAKRVGSWDLVTCLKCLKKKPDTQSGGNGK